MSEFAAGWMLSVDRGPEWLFLVLRKQSATADPVPQLSDHVWELILRHGIYRIVFELDDGTPLTSHLIGQLVLLHRRVHRADGVFRICDFSAECFDVLALMQLSDRFYNYPSREAAVMGHRHVGSSGMRM